MIFRCQIRQTFWRSNSLNDFQKGGKHGVIRQIARLHLCIKNIICTFIGRLSSCYVHRFVQQKIASVPDHCLEVLSDAFETEKV